MEITEIFQAAAKKAQEKNHRLDLPNVYAHGKQHLKYVYPDGTIRIKKIE